ncbi:MAG: tRNA (N(6)-L-threonylcarbamoyladenosine(37)-C(2))-methylthiotransferase MtaB [Alphaproteobacteria bacterium]|nr:tRNA (N(6)-L-threonylcarbamoyladenosine(37)-C(2))-methylthiotransferase MtaB [Alphaproteobacteria bacterium]
MSGVEVVTFGCRLNALESETIRARALAAGLDDAVIINTCAVTAEAERQARQAIRKARRARPTARIVVTGCAAQIDPARYAAMPEVDQVLGNDRKLSVAGLASPARVAVDDAMGLTETGSHLVAGFSERARAYVQVQNGCDHRCTFCIIPFGRGPSRSVAIQDIVAAVRARAAAGVNEVVLTGVDLTAWGGDLPGQPKLGDAVAAVLAGVPELPRLRLSSLDAAEIDPTLLRLLAEEARLMPHLHLSLQSGSDLILKRMKRRHARAAAIAFADRARALRPEVVLGADLIAGFPTETAAMFDETLDLIAACGLVYLHVFPYSPRPGTPASRMPQVPVELRKERAARLRAAGTVAEARYFASLVGRRLTALVEQGDRGRTETYAPIALDRPGPAGAILPAIVTGSSAAGLQGRVGA